MSLAIVHTRAKVGIAAPTVTVEVHLSNGLPSLSIVGLPETAVKESKDRVRSALINAHFDFPPRRITVNLAPADLPKEGGRFDLAIALGILAASGQLPSDQLDKYEFLGELALSGSLRPVDGTLPAALACFEQHRRLIVPEGNAREAALSKNTEVYGAQHLLDVCAHLRADTPQASAPANNKVDTQSLLTRQGFTPPKPHGRSAQLSDVIGQQQAKRALEVAAAGGHNLLFSGPPGTGKTMLASRMPGILPPLDEDEALEVAAVYSVAGTSAPSTSARHDFHERPFRSPHHTASATALVGGGSMPTPGEISLAHRGVLFLDELPEFPRKVLEVLREPLESGSITIARVQARITFPARFLLVAAMNPCPCGYLGSARCRCTPDQISRYQSKISGPLLDRFDLQVSVPQIPRAQLTGRSDSARPSDDPRDKQHEENTSTNVQTRVCNAQARQKNRQGSLNGDLSGKQLSQLCPLNSEQQDLLDSAIDRLGLSARAYHRLLKVARTIADLDDSDAVQTQHLTEAIAYRVTSAYFPGQQNP